MATTKSKHKSKSAVARARKKQPPWLWIGVVGLVLVLAMAAIVSSGGSDNKKSAAGVEETRPVTVTGSALAEYPKNGSDPAVGQEIPEVKGQSFDGSPVTIGKDGRPKLVLFVAHWCPHCRDEIPLLADYLKSNPLPAGVDLYTISTAVSSKSPNYPPSAWLAEESWTAKTLADSENQQAATAFGIGGYPFFMAVDASGKVVDRTSGEITTGQFADLAERTLGNR